MDFLEDLFGFGDKRRGGTGTFNRGNDHHDGGDHDDSGHHDRDGHAEGSEFTDRKSSQECPRCRRVALPGAKFCNDCGQALLANSRVHCLGCGLIQQAGAKYCPGCGAAL